jgi:hypothetical protein
VVGLDCSVPMQLRYYASPAMSPLMGALRTAGILRAVVSVAPGIVSNSYPGHSAADLAGMRRLVEWGYQNTTVRNESRETAANGKELEALRFPATIPVSMVLARESVEQAPRVAPNMDWVSLHRDVIAGNPRASIVVLDGTHFIYHSQSQEIARIIAETVSLAEGGR